MYLIQPSELLTPKSDRTCPCPATSTRLGAVQLPEAFQKQTSLGLHLECVIGVSPPARIGLIGPLRRGGFHRPLQQVIDLFRVDRARGLIHVLDPCLCLL